MKSLFSSLKTERTARKSYRTREDAKADVFDYVARFYNAKRRHSTIGCMSPVEFEMHAGIVRWESTEPGAGQTACRPVEVIAVSSFTRWYCPAHLEILIRNQTPGSMACEYHRL
jgi:hypothetical protein